MLVKTSTLGVSARAEMLNTVYQNHAAIPTLRNALNDPLVGRMALVSSFGAESVVLLHMVATLRPDTTVLFIDTQMLFPETLDYQVTLSAKLGLRNVQVVRTDPTELAKRDPFKRLHLALPDACCALRKNEPLEQALAGFDAWITGRKRFQAGTRAALELFEAEDNKRLKINPLARWRKQDVAEYMQNNALPRHPLVAKGYPSIGCAPCTSAVGENEDERAGRWRGADKTECGIHFGKD
ncbi:MAG: phosphoadenylyl-sulfate reductase [Rhodobacteraceae bacterium]|nr:phosphoadenylyl-sulfate reductase [Paracoccaceae bacterium]